MKTLVVYYSRDGHSRKVAQAIADALKCDIEEIKETQSRTGIIGWIMAGGDACRKKIVPIAEFSKNPADYDLVVIGTPIWAWTMVPAIRSWLDKFGKNLKQVAFFATMGGSGDKKAFAQMEELCGKAPIATSAFIDRETNTDAHKIKLDNFVKDLRELIPKYS